MLIQNVTSDNRVQHVTRWVFTLNFTKIFLPLLLLSFLTLLHPHTEIQVRVLMLDSSFGNARNFKCMEFGFHLQDLEHHFYSLLFVTSLTQTISSSTPIRQLFVWARLAVRNIWGLQYIGAGLQYIGAQKFYLQYSGKE